MTTDNQTYMSLSVNAHKIATLTLNRPDKHNAFDDVMITHLLKHLDDLEACADLRGLIITGTGKSFSAGADIAWMKRMATYDHGENLADARQLARLMRKINGFACPTLALVNGSAFGGALGIMATCDSAISVDTAQFCMSEVRLGIVPAVISPYIMNKLGNSAGRHLMISASTINAQEALRVGLVHHVVPSGELANAGGAWEQQVLSNCPAAIAELKQLLQTLDACSPLNPSAIARTERATTESIAKIRTSPTGQAGLHAFLNKQPMPWQP